MSDSWKLKRAHSFLLRCRTRFEESDSFNSGLDEESRDCLQCCVQHIGQPIYRHDVLCVVEILISVCVCVRASAITKFFFSFQAKPSRDTDADTDRILRHLPARARSANVGPNETCELGHELGVGRLERDVVLFEGTVCKVVPTVVEWLDTCEKVTNHRAS